MLSAEHAATLKRVNVSKDREKTKVRAKEAWSSLSRAEKNAIFDQTGVVKGTLYRIFSTGVITMKLLLPLARAAGFNPFYITGESDARSGFTDEAVLEILKAHKYKTIVKSLESANEEARAKTRRPRRAAAAFEEPDVADEKADDEFAAEPTGEDEMSEGEKEEAASSQGEETAGEEKSKSGECEVVYMLNEEEITCLLKALLIKAEKGGKDAKEKLNALLALLLS